MTSERFQPETSVLTTTIRKVMLEEFSVGTVTELRVKYTIWHGEVRGDAVLVTSCREYWPTGKSTLQRILRAFTTRLTRRMRKNGWNEIEKHVLGTLEKEHSQM